MLLLPIPFPRGQFDSLLSFEEIKWFCKPPPTCTQTVCIVQCSFCYKWSYYNIHSCTFLATFRAKLLCSICRHFCGKLASQREYRRSLNMALQSILYQLDELSQVHCIKRDSFDLMVFVRFHHPLGISKSIVSFWGGNAHVW